MIDIHSHILPGVDDGAVTMEESLEMGRLAVEDGITHLFATPHHKLYTPLSRKDVVQRVNKLQARLDAAGINLTILPGHEVRLEGDVFYEWEEGWASPLGHSRYVLTEPRFNYYDRQTDRMLQKFFARDYIPVMAHPERIRPIQNDLTLIEWFIERGGLTQITAHSLTGYHGQRAREVAEEMLERGMVHIIASDAHHAHRRPPILSAARDIAAAIVGEAQATAMVTTTPLAIVKNEPVLTETVAV